jgi:photosystem II stability/assembly factor-like uncharacterized protein
MSVSCQMAPVGAVSPASAGLNPKGVSTAPAKPRRDPDPVPAAEYGPWRSCRIGGGGYQMNVVFCPRNAKRLYSYMDVGGAFRSDDSGKTWTMLHGGLPAEPGNYEVRSLLVDPRDDRRLLMAVGTQWEGIGGIFRSTDAGKTWKKTLTAPFFGNGEYRWTGVILARAPRRADTVLAASIEEGVFRSDDNGATWKPVGEETTRGLYPTDLRFDPATPNRLYLCAGSVKTWYGGREREWKSAFLRSEDGGKTWARGADQSPTEILSDPKHPGLVYGIVGGAIHRSADSGKTWTLFAEGLPPRRTGKGFTSEDEFQSLAAGPDFVLTASTKGTFYRLAAGGDRWQKVERHSIEEIYRGEEWFRRRTGGFGSALCSIIVDPKDPKRWFFTDWYAVYETRDAGKNWRLSMDGIEATVLHCLTPDPHDPAVVHLGMADNGYFRSANGGVRFGLTDPEKIGSNLKSVSVSLKRAGRVYAAGAFHWYANQVYRSDDGGRTWAASPMTGLPDMKDRRCNTVVADASDSDTVYLAVSGGVGEGAGGVYRSVDGGRSWTGFGAGLPTGTDFFTKSIWHTGPEIAASSGGMLICFSRDRRAIYRYDPRSNAWSDTNLKPGGAPYSVVADPQSPGRFFLGIENDGVYRTDDGGREWKRVYAGSVRHLAADARTAGRVAAGTADGIVWSRDGGQTWQMLDRRLPYRRYNLVCFAGDRLLAGTSGSGAFWMPLP